MEIQIPIFVIPFFIAVLFQFIKVIIDFIRTKKFLVSGFFIAGGFPSVHSAACSSLTTIVFLKTGIYNIEFAIAIVFSTLFVYDAMNIRYEAGKHAYYINTIKDQLQEALHKKGQNITLKERLGHTPIEVVGGILLGCLATILLVKLLGGC